jgi:secreted trypsin-like serine protease
MNPHRRPGPNLAVTVTTKVSVQHAQFAWMGALLRGTGAEATLSCGVSLIAPGWALGAAHCHPKDANPGSFTVRFDSAQWSSGGVLVPVASFLDQPGTDLSLVKLAAPVTTIHPITYSTSVVDPAYTVGTRAESMGWGTSSEAETTPSNTLRWVSEQTYSATTCGLISGDVAVFCAGAPGAKGSALCKRDSGAPYVYSPLGFDSHGDPFGPVEVAGTLRGLTNETCGRPDENDDFQETAASAAWIAQTIGATNSAHG